MGSKIKKKVKSTPRIEEKRHREPGNGNKNQEKAQKYPRTREAEKGENMNQIIMIYLAVMNIVGVAAMGVDKWKARHHAWRIPEKTLFLISLLGGSIGTWAGMYLFRHKTKHMQFVIGMPLILAVQIVAAGYWLHFR